MAAATCAALLLALVAGSQAAEARALLQHAAAALDAPPPASPSGAAISLADRVKHQVKVFQRRMGELRKALPFAPQITAERPDWCSLRPHATAFEPSTMVRWGAAARRAAQSACMPRLPATRPSGAGALGGACHARARAAPPHLGRRGRHAGRRPVDGHPPQRRAEAAGPPPRPRPPAGAARSTRSTATCCTTTASGLRWRARARRRPPWT